MGIDEQQGARLKGLAGCQQKGRKTKVNSAFSRLRFLADSEEDFGKGGCF